MWKKMAWKKMVWKKLKDGVGKDGVEEDGVVKDDVGMSEHRGKNKSLRNQILCALPPTMNWLEKRTHCKTRSIFFYRFFREVAAISVYETFPAYYLFHHFHLYCDH